LRCKPNSCVAVDVDLDIVQTSVGRTAARNDAGISAPHCVIVFSICTSAFEVRTKGKLQQ
jgi:hypothetical protein